MDFGQGILAAVSKSSNASKELADDGKNILFIDHDSFTIFLNSTKYRLKLSEKAMQMTGFALFMKTARMGQLSSLRTSVTQTASCAPAVYHPGGNATLSQ